MKLNKLVKGEKGQALIIVVLLMMVSALVIAPMLSHVSTGLRTGKEVYEEKMKLFYSADSGIEDGLWQVENEQLCDALFGTDDPPYDPYAYYDYSPSNEWDYDLPEDLNDKGVNVALRNIWIPKGITAPAPGPARDIIEGIGGDPPKLIISGSVSATSTYQIKIAYYYDDAEDSGGTHLEVDTVGIWLPPGFDYVDDSCSLEGEYYYDDPDNDGYCSGRALVWTFGPTPLVNFPGSTGYPLEKSFTFQFSSPVNVNPGAALSWIDTIGVNSVEYAWDADVKVYKVASTATDNTFDPVKQTVVEAYTAKSEMRELGSTISGDYVAVGNSLMMPDPNDSNFGGRLLKESSAPVSSGSEQDQIPANATVQAAYLYWSGFIDHYYWYWHTQTTDPYPDGWYFSSDSDNSTGTVYDASDLSQMFANAKVNTVSFGVSGVMQDITADQWQVCLKTNDSPNCWYYTCLYDATDLVDQLIEYDKLESNGSGTYTLGHVSGVKNQNPPRNITIDFPREPNDTGFSPSPGYSFDLYNSSGSSTVGYTGYPLGTPATKLPGAPSYQPRKQIENYYGNWQSPNRYNASYAGWSLVIIYSTPDIKGHQLYLYDISDPNFTFKESYQSDMDFDGDGSPGGNISGFLVPQPITGETNAAKITCFVGEGDENKSGESFKVTGPSGTGEYLLDGTGAPWNNVWNSKSLGANASGVDIDTFYVPWGTPPGNGILRPGDTSAQINLPSPNDGITLSYIILSFRSEITSGGTISYLVRG